jgi:Rrf2 family protein
MRLGEGVEWALHCATVLALVPDGMSMPGGRLAEFHGVPTAYLAKTMQSLSRAGIVESVPGRKGGYRLARRATEVTLLDVVLAVEGEEPAFRCSEIRRRGPASVPARHYAHVCSIASAMWRAEQAWRHELETTTVADLLGQLAHTISPEAAAKGAAWMQEVLS